MAEESIDIRSEVDRDGRQFIAAIDYFGGEATMTEIRSRTGMDWGVADWRFRRFDDLGLIKVSYAESGRGDRDPPRVATLTGLARQEIERGLLYDIDKSRSHEEINDLATEIRALREEVDRLEARVDVLTKTEPDNDRLSNLESRLETVEEDVRTLTTWMHDWGTEATERIQLAGDILTDDFGVDFFGRLEDRQRREE